ncbi:MAG TPA: sigma factor-like helix-turn-helix DNA-binding protein [Bryobacteraceae bacterium]|nr:sigma factor-like helix-turn-helix DNA-binding protein [Bryobacteraceae bacterium]
MNIAQISLRRLRAAIQSHEVSFPAQVPIFECQSRPDIQWRLVELYFVRNWSCPELGERYGVTMERARQLISQWVQRAIVLGYLQAIPTAASLSEAPAAVDQVSLETPLPVLTAAILSEPLVHAAAASNGR